MINIHKQEELRKFVDEEVYTCQSSLVEEALKREFFSWDDVENLYRPFDNNYLTDVMTCQSCGEVSNRLDRETEECKSCFEENQQPQDIYEWWVVSDWLSILLRKLGEPILNNNYGTWWGRCTTGQAILLDDVINKIYDEIIK